jgi:hypothetical protein
MQARPEAPGEDFEPSRHIKPWGWMSSLGGSLEDDSESESSLSASITFLVDLVAQEKRQQREEREAAAAAVNDSRMGTPMVMRTPASPESGKRTAKHFASSPSPGTRGGGARNKKYLDSSVASAHTGGLASPSKHASFKGNHDRANTSSMGGAAHDSLMISRTSSHGSDFGRRPSSSGRARRVAVKRHVSQPENWWGGHVYVICAPAMRRDALPLVRSWLSRGGLRTWPDEGIAPMLQPGASGDEIIAPSWARGVSTSACVLLLWGSGGGGVGESAECVSALTFAASIGKEIVIAQIPFGDTAPNPPYTSPRSSSSASASASPAAVAPQIEHSYAPPPHVPSAWWAEGATIVDLRKDSGQTGSALLRVLGTRGMRPSVLELVLEGAGRAWWDDGGEERFVGAVARGCSIQGAEERELVAVLEVTEVEGEDDGVDHEDGRKSHGDVGTEAEILNGGTAERLTIRDDDEYDGETGYDHRGGRFSFPTALRVSFAISERREGEWAMALSRLMDSASSSATTDAGVSVFEEIGMSVRGGVIEVLGEEHPKVRAN